MSWIPFALLSAVFAALTAILGKKGVENVDSNLAVAIRTTVVVTLAWIVAATSTRAADLRAVPRNAWLYLILSGLATGLSWLYYYRALQLGPASRVAPVDKLSVAITILLAFAFLGERPTPGNVIGGALITAGVLVAALAR